MIINSTPTRLHYSERPPRLVSQWAPLANTIRFPSQLRFMFSPQQTQTLMKSTPTRRLHSTRPTPMMSHWAPQINLTTLPILHLRFVFSLDLQYLGPPASVTASPTAKIVRTLTFPLKIARVHAQSIHTIQNWIYISIKTSVDVDIHQLIFTLIFYNTFYRLHNLLVSMHYFWSNCRDCG